MAKLENLINDSVELFQQFHKTIIVALILIYYRQ